MIEQEIISYVDEFLAKNGKVTIEFSTYKDKLNDLFVLLNKVPHPNCVWTAHTCSTCEKHHDSGYVHIELHSLNSTFTKHSLNASNLIQRTK